MGTALKDPQVARAYLRALDRISRSAYLDRIASSLDEQYRVYRRALIRDTFPLTDPDIGAQSLARDLWAELRVRQAVIRGSLDDGNRVFASIAYSRDDAAAGEVVVEVRNILSLPVEVVGLRVGSSFIPAAQAWERSDSALSDGDGTAILLPVARHNVLEPAGIVRFRIPDVAVTAMRKARDASPDVRVLTRISGLANERATPVTTYGRLSSVSPPAPRPLAGNGAERSRFPAPRLPR